MANIRDTEAAAASGAKAYAIFVRANAAKLMKVARDFAGDYDKMQAAYARAREAQATAIRARGDRPQDFPLDERPEMRAMPVEEARAFYFLAEKLARAGGGALVPPVNPFNP